MRSLGAAYVRTQLADVMDAVQQTHERVVITRDGRPAVVMMAVEDLEAVEETLAILSDPGLLLDIQAGRRDVEEGDVVALEDIAHGAPS